MGLRTNIAVLGTGTVGRTLAKRLHELGNEVVIGTRDPAPTLLRDGFGARAAAHPDVTIATFSKATEGAEPVVNALSGGASATGMAAAELEPGTVLLDASNPLDASAGFPPHLFGADTAHSRSSCSLPSRACRW